MSNIVVTDQTDMTETAEDFLPPIKLKCTPCTLPGDESEPTQWTYTNEENGEYEGLVWRDMVSKQFYNRIGGQDGEVFGPFATFEEADYDLRVPFEGETEAPIEQTPVEQTPVTAADALAKTAPETVAVQMIATYKEARAILRKKVKVAVQVGFEGPYVFVEKTDFLNQVLKSGDDESTFTDPEGKPVAVDLEGDVLYIPIGVR